MATEKFVCRFTVYGDAQPAGSKRAFAIPGRTRQSGAPMIVVTDDNKKSKPWKSQVSSEARDAMTTESGTILAPATGPLKVLIVFYRPRPKNHFRSGANSHDVKASSPEWPTTKPDVLKLARGVEDAMSGLVYVDDNQIVIEHLEKRYDATARCDVTVWTLGE